ncbi:MurR/RpiR family transcriptional regulator [Trichococcus shcherbakoviae]|uniref:MurR/RpiR family transcriptional regulator n=1 Tax=Trichococcus shcherbakoviae subsp. psychrophilus TaxID=2585775 RepID=A0A5C5E7Q0_9LACT|nr:MurR/RpiR family transcriptional regulator [Trichococcus shcherbakoviae]OUL08554.1 RpiR family transcriptional regulator [Sedimentibacter sp. SX930]TNV68272.1 MurR/RpiR family transcriptional regulator [Trichococcus shcherbakoviae subsp. psychrophilus]
MQSNLLFRIEEKMADLPQSEKKIAATILADPTAVIQMNATSLALQAGSSPAAVIRFCHSIGLKGFTQLKLNLSADTQGIQEKLYSEIQPGEELEQIKKKFLMQTYHIFEETNQTLTNDCVARATQWFHESKVIFTYGIGASHLAALDLQQKFSRIGKSMICSQDQHLLVTSMSVMEENAVFFGVSNSGEKQEVIALMKTAKKLGIKTISLTKDTTNTLSQLSDLSLKTANSHEAPLRSGATVSLLAQMYAVDLLFYDFATKHYDTTINNLEKSKEAIRSLTHGSEEHD